VIQPFNLGFLSCHRNDNAQLTTMNPSHGNTMEYLYPDSRGVTTGSTHVWLLQRWGFQLIQLELSPSMDNPSNSSSCLQQLSDFETWGHKLVIACYRSITTEPKLGSPLATLHRPGFPVPTPPSGSEVAAHLPTQDTQVPGSFGHPSLQALKM